jgi:hypothetical protein
MAPKPLPPDSGGRKKVPDDTDSGRQATSRLVAESAPAKKTWGEMAEDGESPPQASMKPSKTDDSSVRVGIAIAQMQDVLGGLSNREKSQVLKAIGGIHGFTVVPHTTMAFQAQAASRASVKQKQPKSKPPSRKPDSSSLALNENQKKIRKAKSELQTSVLPDSHPLVVERVRLLAARKTEASSAFRDEAQKASPKSQAPPS